MPIVKSRTGVRSSGVSRVRQGPGRGRVQFTGRGIPSGLGIGGGGGGGGATLPLDGMPQPLAAYAFRKLRTAYAGPCCRIRRSTDNAELDIGFAGNTLDVAALLAHCGAGSGFVATWHDQGGAGNHSVQATQNAQFQLVNAGALVQTDDDGWPAASLNGTTQVMEMPNVPAALSGNDTPSTIFYKFSSNNTSNSYDCLCMANSAVSNSRHMLRLNATNGRFVMIRGDSAGTLTATGDGAVAGSGWDLWSQVFPGTTVSWWVDGVQDKAAFAFDVGDTTFTHASIGARRSGGAYSGYMPGFVALCIVWASALSDPNRTALEAAL